MWLALALDVAIGAPFIVVAYLRGDFIDTQKRYNWPLRLVGVTGDRIKLQLFEGESIQGKWGSKNGVRLSLANRSVGAFRIERTVVTRRTFKSASRGEESFHVRTWLKVPDLHQSEHETPPEPELFAGRLLGDIQYPRSKTEKATFDVVIPFTLLVVTEGVTSGNYSKRTWRIFWVASVPDTALVVGLGVAVARIL
ncbi:MAG: hypothetical protein QF368_11720 [SAR202 cluster bacterium]|nr:hypothetical protein [SAR202 cluster bacterium]